MNRGKRFLVYFLCLLLCYTPVLQSAAELTDAQRQEITNQVQGMEAFIQGKDPITPEEGQQIFTNNIGSGNTQKLKQNSHDAAALGTYGAQYKSELYEDSQSEEPTEDGKAYQLIQYDQQHVDRTRNLTTLDGQNLNAENAIFDTTRNTLDNLEQFASEFAGCSESVTLTTTEKQVPNPEYHYCERDFLKEDKYTIIHNIFLEERSEEKRRKYQTAQNTQNRSSTASRAADPVPLIPDYAVVEPADAKSQVATANGLSTLGFAVDSRLVSVHSPMMLVHKRKYKILHPEEIDAAYISNLELPAVGKVLINGQVVADRTHPQLRKELFNRAFLTKAQYAWDSDRPHHDWSRISVAVPANTVFAAVEHPLPDELYLTHKNVPATYNGKHIANSQARHRVEELFTSPRIQKDGVYIDKNKILSDPPIASGLCGNYDQSGSMRVLNKFFNPYKEKGRIDVTGVLQNLQKGQELDIEVWGLLINFPDQVMCTGQIHQIHGSESIRAAFQRRTYTDQNSDPPRRGYQTDGKFKMSMVLDLGAKKQETYSNPTALAIIAKGEDENTKITTSCKVMRSNIEPEDRTSCTNIQGRRICPDDLMDSPKGLEHLSKMCLEYEVRVEKKVCGWADENTQKCIFRSEVPDSCELYRTNPLCRLSGRLCSKEPVANKQHAQYSESIQQCAEDESTLEEWDCGVPLKLKEHEVTNNYDCPGAIKCMGTDCIGEYSEKNVPSSFGKVTALAKAAEMAAQDTDCYDPNTQLIPDDRIGRCRIFVGNVQSCGDPYFRMGSFKANRCCNPKGVTVNPKDYLGATIKLAQLHYGIMNLENGNMIKGAYQTFQKPIANGLSYVTRPFTSAIENVTASTKEFFKPVTEYVQQALAKLKQKAAEVINKLFAKQTATSTGQAAGSTAATQAAQKAGEQAAQEVTNKILAGVMQGANAIMLAYTAYQVGELANQIYNACDKIEENHGTGNMQLAVNKKLGNCSARPFRVGSRKRDSATKVRYEYYCCYNSPMARIFSEQIAKHLHLSPEELSKRAQEDAAARAAGKWVADPNSCGGVRIEDLEKVDWDNVDLSEWTALLQKHNLDIDPASMTLDKLTGKGSTLADALGDTEGGKQRKNAAERTIERLTPQVPDPYHFDKINKKQQYDLEQDIRYD